MTPKSFNPFTENTAGQYFVGRESALQLFTASLNGLSAKTPSHIYVAGVHGTGKTSYLHKLCEIADSRKFLGVYLNLDERHRGHEHVGKILRSVIEKLDGQIASDAKPLTRDWERGKDAAIFSHPHSDQIDSGHIYNDFLKLRSYMQSMNSPGAVICIDEGQRITPDALSALKNALQSIDSYLVVISLRLIQENISATAAGRSLLDERAKEAEGDFGASRFFINGVPMGPFETDQEAYECIRRRLTNNAVTFDDMVIETIVRITDAIPREMISLSSQVYNRALLANSTMVNMALLNEAFVSIRRAEFRQAQSLCGSLSGIERRVLRALLSFRRPATLDDLVKNFGEFAEDVREALSSGISGALERIQSNFALCHKSDDGYEVRGSIYRYALELALSERLS
jgi:AAA ATPase domain